MKKLIKKLAGFLGYSITSIRDNDNLAKPLNRTHFFDIYFANVTKDFFFVQIGANDGKKKDPLNPYVTKYNLSGISIEPQPKVFERLQETYKGTNVQCVNAAIAENTGSLPFYSVRQPIGATDSFIWMTTLASFDRDFLRRTLAKNMRGKSSDDLIQETQVKALSFSDFAKMYNVERIDFLQLDCEGWDWKILKTIDLKKYSPTIINFESNYLSDAEWKEVDDLLARFGYRWFQYGNDTCAYRI